MSIPSNLPAPSPIRPTPVLKGKSSMLQRKPLPSLGESESSQALPLKRNGQLPPIQSSEGSLGEKISRVKSRVKALYSLGEGKPLELPPMTEDRAGSVIPF